MSEPVRTSRPSHCRGCRQAAGVCALTLCLLQCAPPPASLEITAGQNTDRLAAYQTFELTFEHRMHYPDPQWDVAIDVAFVSPGGRRYTVGGFYYGPIDRLDVEVQPLHEVGSGDVAGAPQVGGVWKARYAPREQGQWRFEYRFTNQDSETATGSGVFEVVRGRAPGPGWVRVNPHNPRRFLFEDGSPYFPIGFQDCFGDGGQAGSILDSSWMEGPFALDRADGHPDPPPGAMFARGPSMNPQNFDVHAGRHSRAGFDLFRFSPVNCSPLLFVDPDAPNQLDLSHVSWPQAAMIDELLRRTRNYGMRNFYGIFGFAQVCNEEARDRRCMAQVRRLLKYSVDRWGAYVDIWELLNEQDASDEWYRIMIDDLAALDPYDKPVATSWHRPELDGIDINAPHWYANENELRSDLVMVEQIARDGQGIGKPIVYGEQGNHRGAVDRTAEGIGGVWDPGSSRRMRVRSWTAFFNEAALIFWETSGAKDRHHMNIWLGPEERQYVRVLQDFAYRLDPAIEMGDPALDGVQAGDVRVYGLGSPTRAAAYLHHGACEACRLAAEAGGVPVHAWDHDRGLVTDLELTLDIPQSSRAYWYDPRDARIVEQLDVEPGRKTLAVPPFAVDLALLITDDGAPDVDGDGVPNDRDDDDDNDGVPDLVDAFPLEREEQHDVDGDRIGDSLDADIDADGVADDLNRDGIPDNAETDPDGDGIATSAAVPWDAFPRDREEWRDTDGDGTGDNADPDADGDGYSNVEEAGAGTDPLDPVSFPRAEASP